MCQSGNEAQVCPHCGGKLIRGPARDDSAALCVNGCLAGPREPLPATQDEPRKCPQCKRPMKLEVEIDPLSNPDGICVNCQAVNYYTRQRGAV
jgi:DNA-directed RNA polymerase subunit RPC12/RpoP